MVSEERKGENSGQWEVGRGRMEEWKGGRLSESRINRITQISRIKIAKWVASGI